MAYRSKIKSIKQTNNNKSTPALKPKLTTASYRQGTCFSIFMEQSGVDCCLSANNVGADLSSGRALFQRRGAATKETLPCHDFTSRY